MRHTIKILESFEHNHREFQCTGWGCTCKFYDHDLKFTVSKFIEEDSKKFETIIDSRAGEWFDKSYIRIPDDFDAKLEKIFKKLQKCPCCRSVRILRFVIGHDVTMRDMNTYEQYLSFRCKIKTDRKGGYNGFKIYHVQEEPDEEDMLQD